MADSCDNIQCPLAPTCSRYLPWEPCELPYDIGNEAAHCPYYLPNGYKHKPIQTELFK